MDHRSDRAAETASPALERLPSRRQAPFAVAAGMVGFLGLVIWAPWGHEPGGRAQPSPPTASQGPAALPFAVRPVAPAASPPPGSIGVGRTARYESITDNEWTIVALLTPGAGPSVEEPATPHVPVAAPTADGPFVVMQQGILPVAAPLEQAGDLAVTCSTTTTPRDRRFVHLPRGRVVYLGVTFPGMDRSARVDARAVGGPTVELRPAASVAVQLDGMQPGVRYTVPVSGPGGTLLFTAMPATRLPSGPYRFELRLPGIPGSRFLYACVDD